MLGLLGLLFGLGVGLFVGGMVTTLTGNWRGGLVAGVATACFWASVALVLSAAFLL